MQKIIFLYGPSCAGKSTVAEEIMKQENIVHVHYDILKWDIPNYSRENKDHRNQIHEKMFLQIDQKFMQGFSLLIEGLSCEQFEKLKQSYEGHVTFFAIKMTARLEVLEKRFTERLEQMKNSNKKISNTSLEIFRKLFKKYNTESTAGIIIDTSEISFLETKQQIENYINGNI